MRPDSIGIFWQDLPKSRADMRMARVMPEIPETGWRPPTYFPNLSGAPYISIDVETFDPELTDYGPGWARGSGHLIGVSVGVPGHNWYFPLRHEVQPELNMDEAHVIAWLKDTLCHKHQPKLGANLIYDVGWLTHYGIHVAGELYDVQCAEALLDETANTNLDALGERYLGEGKSTNVLNQWSCDYYGGSIHDQRKNLYRCPPSLVGPYAEMDTDLPQRILPIQWQQMEKEGLLALFHMECRLIPLMIAMRKKGVRVDVKKAEKIRDDILLHEKVVQGEINAMAGMQVNTSAAESLRKAFTKLGIRLPVKQDGKVSFSKETLPLVEHPFADKILDLRKVNKIRTTFIESYILDSQRDGRVYCEFHPLRSDRGGTRSGRMASSNPNLQNVPSRDEILAALVRGAFLPDIGHKQWLRFDYSQVEYRGLAHFAVGEGCDDLRAQYNSDPKTDYHVHTQNLVQRVIGREISRKPIKNINFGLTYGMGQGKLARTLNLGKKAAEELFDAYHMAAPFAQKTAEHYSALASRNGYIQTILGRRSRFDLWEPARRDGEREIGLSYRAALSKYGSNIKRAYTHKALNRVLQGSAADLMKKAMLDCWESGVFNYTGVPMLTVHDELDFSDPGGVDHAFDYIQHVMETAIPFRVPILVDKDVGSSWGDAT